MRAPILGLTSTRKQFEPFLEGVFASFFDHFEPKFGHALSLNFGVFEPKLSKALGLTFALCGLLWARLWASILGILCFFLGNALGLNSDNLGFVLRKALG